MNDCIINIKDLKVYFPVKAGVFQKTVGQIKAIDGVNLVIRKGETLGLVGESGCGKTTLGRSIARLNTPVSGKIIFDGKADILKLEGKELRKLRRKIQMVFQDPYSSLNPRHTVKRLIGEVLKVKMGLKKNEIDVRIAQLLKQVDLNPIYAERYPHEFSGGQRQRIAIAKAIALEPEFLICDEAVSALDVSIRSQIINLLIDLKRQYPNMAYLFISHELNIVEHIADRVAVMYLGKIVELADNSELFDHPLHPYTQALFSANPVLAGRKKRNRIILKGEVPNAINVPEGCRFHPRCFSATRICFEKEPRLEEKTPSHWVACHIV